jgi:4-alpha-glucanotransferase
MAMFRAAFTPNSTRMPPLSFVFCLHNHQPEGNFDAVFRQSAHDAYRPFLELLAAHPRVPATMHCSGILLDWLERNDRETFDLIGTCVQRRQLELLGGGFHEPVLPAIPHADAVGQIRKLSTWLEQRFGVRPRGMWLAERVWEQHLVRVMHEAGMEYTVLDDTHFQYAGLPEERLTGYFMTEDQGRTLAVFPIARHLRYLIPFGSVDETIDHLRSVALRHPGATIVYADDGEKFGVWPRTYAHVWDARWLERFFEALEQHADWLRVRHFADVLDTTAPEGRTYLPNASYAEMMHWSLPDPVLYRAYERFERDLAARGEGDHARAFVRGGFWRNFMVKYPEINAMHKKMLRVSHRLHALEPAEASGEFTAARNALWAAQCNCPYWHGVFGGLYLPHIRSEVYRNLIRAERALDRIEGVQDVRIDVVDYDADGHREVLVETPQLNAFFTPHEGAMCIELDLKASAYNLVDTMTRREEGYHAQVRHATTEGEHGDGTRSIHDIVQAKEQGLADHIVYDWHRKGAFVDHILADDVTLEQFARAAYTDLGDFATQPWEHAIEARGDEHVVRFTRNGAARTNGTSFEVRITKTFVFKAESDSVDVSYVVEAPQGVPPDAWFAVEYNVNMLSGDAPDRYIDVVGCSVPRVPAGARGAVPICDVVTVTNEWDDVRFEVTTDLQAELWHAPIETVSLSEDGFERTYQGTTLLLRWRLEPQLPLVIHLHHRVTTFR